MDKHFFKYFISVLLFGSNGIIASNINLTSYEIVLWRTLIGSALLISLFFISGRKVTFPHYKKDMLFIVFSGISMGTSWMFLYEAYFQIGVSLAILLYYTGPVIVMVLSPLLFKEKLGFEKVIGFVAVLIGTVFINSSFSADTFNGWGIFNTTSYKFLYSKYILRCENRFSSSNTKSRHFVGIAFRNCKHRHRLLFVFFVDFSHPGTNSCNMRMLRTSFLGYTRCYNTTRMDVIKRNYWCSFNNRRCFLC